MHCINFRSEGWAFTPNMALKFSEMYVGSLPNFANTLTGFAGRLLFTGFSAADALDNAGLPLADATVE